MTKQAKITTRAYIEMISKDYQFDKKHEGYLGFINIDPQDAIELGSDHSDAAIQIAMNPGQFEAIFNEYGLSIQSAHESELIIEELNS